MPTLKPNAVETLTKFIADCEELLREDQRRLQTVRGPIGLKKEDHERLQELGFGRYFDKVINDYRFESFYDEISLHYNEFRGIFAYFKSYDEYKKYLDEDSQTYLHNYKIDNEDYYNKLKEIYNIESKRPYSHRQVLAIIHIAKEIRDKLSEYTITNATKLTNLKKHFSTIDMDKGTWIPAIFAKKSEGNVVNLEDFNLSLKMSSLMMETLQNFKVHRNPKLEKGEKSDVTFTVAENLALRLWEQAGKIPQEIINDLSDGLQASIGLFEFYRQSVSGADTCQTISLNIPKDIENIVQTTIMAKKDFSQYEKSLTEYFTKEVLDKIEGLPFRGFSSVTNISEFDKDENIKDIYLEPAGDYAITQVLSQEVSKLTELYILSDQFFTPFNKILSKAWDENGNKQIIDSCKKAIEKFVHDSSQYNKDQVKKGKLNKLIEEIENKNISKSFINRHNCESVFTEYYFSQMKNTSTLSELKPFERESYNRYIDNLPEIFSKEDKESFKKNTKPIAVIFSRYIPKNISLQSNIFELFKLIQLTINEHNKYCNENSKMPGNTGKILNDFRKEIMDQLKKVTYKQDPYFVYLLLNNQNSIKNAQRILPTLDKFRKDIQDSVIFLKQLFELIGSIDSSEEQLFMKASEFKEKIKLVIEERDLLWENEQISFSILNVFRFFYEDHLIDIPQDKVKYEEDLMKFADECVSTQLPLKKELLGIKKSVTEMQEKINKVYQNTLSNIQPHTNEVKINLDLDDFDAQIEQQEKILQNLKANFEAVNHFLDLENCFSQSKNTIKSKVDELAKQIKNKNIVEEINSSLKSMESSANEMKSKRNSFELKIRSVEQEIENIKAKRDYEAQLNTGSPRGILRAKEILQSSIDNQEILIKKTKKELETINSKIEQNKSELENEQSSLENKKTEFKKLKKRIEGTKSALEAIPKGLPDDLTGYIELLQNEITKFNILEEENGKIKNDLSVLNNVIKLCLSSKDYKIAYSEIDLFNEATNILKTDFANDQERESFEKNLQERKALQENYENNPARQVLSAARSYFTSDTTENVLLKHKKDLLEMISKRINTLEEYQKDIESKKIEENLRTLKEKQKICQHFIELDKVYFRHLDAKKEVEASIRESISKVEEIKTELQSLNFSQTNLSNELSTQNSRKENLDSRMSEIEEKLETVIRDYNVDKDKFIIEFNKLEQDFVNYKKDLNWMSHSVLFGDNRLQQTLYAYGKSKNSVPSLERLAALMEEEQLLVSTSPKLTRKDLEKELDKLSFEINAQELYNKFKLLKDQAPPSEKAQYDNLEPRLNYILNNYELLQSTNLRNKTGLKAQINKVDEITQIIADEKEKVERLLIKNENDEITEGTIEANLEKIEHDIEKIDIHTYLPSDVEIFLETAREKILKIKENLHEKDVIQVPPLHAIIDPSIIHRINENNQKILNWNSKINRQKENSKRIEQKITDFEKKYLKYKKSHLELSNKYFTLLNKIPETRGFNFFDFFRKKNTLQTDLIKLVNKFEKTLDPESLKSFLENKLEENKILQRGKGKQIIFPQGIQKMSLEQISKNTKNNINAIMYKLLYEINELEKEQQPKPQPMPFSRA